MSKKALFTVYFFLFIGSFVYYPKWNKANTEAVISWDTSGYYWYLPATFIYKDLSKLEFSTQILEKYHCSPYFDQAFDHISGNKILKYSSGMAVQYLPFFLAAHVTAPLLGFEADGFSLPYQFAIQFGSFLMALLGLWFFRKVLLHFFDELVTSLVLIAIFFGTNYLNFASIDSAMTHNWLFSWYSILLYTTIKIYNAPSYKLAGILGICLGTLALTRPTEAIAFLIPIFWTLNIFDKNGIKEWAIKIWKLNKFVILSAVIMVMIGMIQLIYYKSIGKEWFIYSYQEYGFSWLSPHIYNYLFSFGTGWLIYTPLFFLLIPGFYIMLRNKVLQSFAIIAFSALFFYIVSAWDFWMYGGRAMVQAYPILGIVMGFSFQWLLQNSFVKYLLYAFVAFCIYYNVWWTHGVHTGGYYDAYNSTKAYFMHTVLRWNIPKDYVKLYDTGEVFLQKRKNVEVLHTNNFDADTSIQNLNFVISASPSDGVNKERQFSSTTSTPLPANKYKWIRVNADLYTKSKEWNVWAMPQFIVNIKKDNVVIKSSMFRINRILNENELKNLFLDVSLPDEYANMVEFSVWNANSDRELLIDNVVIEGYE